MFRKLIAIIFIIGSFQTVLYGMEVEGRFTPKASVIRCSDGDFIVPDQVQRYITPTNSQIPYNKAEAETLINFVTLYNDNCNKEHKQAKLWDIIGINHSCKKKSTKNKNTVLDQNTAFDNWEGHQRIEHIWLKQIIDVSLLHKVNFKINDLVTCFSMIQSNSIVITNDNLVANLANLFYDQFDTIDQSNIIAFNRIKKAGLEPFLLGLHNLVEDKPNDDDEFERHSLTQKEVNPNSYHNPHWLAGMELRCLRGIVSFVNNNVFNITTKSTINLSSNKIQEVTRGEIDTLLEHAPRILGNKVLEPENRAQLSFGERSVTINFKANPLSAETKALFTSINEENQNQEALLQAYEGTSAKVDRIIYSPLTYGISGVLSCILIFLLMYSNNTFLKTGLGCGVILGCISGLMLMRAWLLPPSNPNQLFVHIEYDE